MASRHGTNKQVTRGLPSLLGLGHTQGRVDRFLSGARGEGRGRERGKEREGKWEGNVIRSSRSRMNRVCLLRDRKHQILTEELATSIFRRLQLGDASFFPLPPTLSAFKTRSAPMNIFQSLLVVSNLNLFFRVRLRFHSVPRNDSSARCLPDSRV